MTLLMMSHLTGSAVLDQGPDHRSVLGLVLRQAEAETYVILQGDWKLESHCGCTPQVAVYVKVFDFKGTLSVIFLC